MFGEFLSFELRSRLRQPTVWLFGALFALMAFGATTTDAITIGGGSGLTAINSPFVIAEMIGILSVIGVLIVTAFVATAIVRDYEQRTYSLFYTCPIKRGDLLFGRFFGSLAMAWIVFVITAFGLAIGSIMPWLDAERLVPHQPAVYVWSLLVLAFPNLFTMGAVFFAVATLTRRVMFAYVAVAAFFVIYIVSQNLISGLENDTLAALSDPFGLSAISVETRYWTLAERNSVFPGFGRLVFLNRLLWIGVGAVALVWTYVRFRLSVPMEGGRRKLTDDDVAASRVDVELPLVHMRHGFRQSIAQCLHQMQVELSGVLRSTPFIVILLFAVLNVFGGIWGAMDNMFGTPVYPVTYMMVEIIDGASSLFVLIVIVFYSGELAWKERKIGLGEVYDALPVPSWVPLVAKYFALVVAVAVLLFASMLTATLFQLGAGWTQIEFGVYAKGLFVIALSRWALLVALATAAQALTNQKYVGFMVMVGFFVAQTVLPALDFEHGLYRYAAEASGPYSDMNGYGQFPTAMLWFRLYWGLFALLLLIAAGLLWPRGTDARWKLRVRQARARFRGKVAAATVLVVAAFAGCGAYIFYNTNVLNDYAPSDEQQDLQALFERRYKQYEKLPQPRVVAADVSVDLYPSERRVDFRGTLELENRSGSPIDEIHVTLAPELEARALELPGATLEHHDEEIGYRIYRLATPLVADATTTLSFDVGFAERGFKERGSNTSVVANGSFMHSTGFLPRIGYDPSAELSDPNERRDRDLPERVRMADLDDLEARQNTYISGEADWIRFAATVSTSADQIALAPGYLVREWQEGDRRFFRYEMDAPILDFYAFLSARWDVTRDTWTSADGTREVAVEVYHHPTHTMNVARMIDATKKSLDYFTVAFSPYQHRQVRIIEFPRYQNFAQSLPNTIPYSESIGFIADLRDAEEIDYVFYVTAHEVAHQWWAHQVIGGDVQGSTVMSETLSQYSALMVMEKEYGRDQMRKFLEYELDRYLSGRGQERHKELPLMRVENQPYIHYNKGSLVMYALREYMGEDRLNAVLAQYIRDVGFQQPPYTNARDLVERIRAAIQPEYAYLVEDLFETITLYDNRTHGATATQLDDGRWRVELDVETRKLRADETGTEVAVPIADFIEVGAFVEKEVDGRMQQVPIHLEKQQFTGDRSVISFIVDEQPTRAGIDPRVLLVDRDPDDNVRAVTEE
jgi:ABC-type transport system involved in multi-copper enzyme maturation permease subunit